MPIRRPARADLCGEVHRQGANDGITALDVLQVSVWDMAIKRGTVVFDPLQSTRMSANEPHCHKKPTSIEDSAIVNGKRVCVGSVKLEMSGGGLQRHIPLKLLWVLRFGALTL